MKGEKHQKCQHPQETQGRQNPIQGRKRNFTTKENFADFVRIRI